VGGIGVTALEGDDGWLEPLAVNATTVNVYVTPLVSPLTVIGLALPLAVIPPGFDVTVYESTGLPPSSSGAWKLTTANPLLAAADTFSGGLSDVLEVQ